MPAATVDHSQRICEVWANNLEEELKRIRHVICKYNYIAMVWSLESNSSAYNLLLILNGICWNFYLVETGYMHLYFFVCIYNGGLIRDCFMSIVVAHIVLMFEPH